MDRSEIVEGRSYIRRDGRVTGRLMRQGTEDPIYYYAVLDGQQMRDPEFVDGNGYPWGVQLGDKPPEELVQVFTGPQQPKSDAGTETREEIIITPEMLEAGTGALFKWSGEFDFERLPASEISALVRDVVSAAIKAQKAR